MKPLSGLIPAPGGTTMMGGGLRAKTNHSAGADFLFA